MAACEAACTRREIQFSHSPPARYAVPAETALKPEAKLATIQNARGKTYWVAKVGAIHRINVPDPAPWLLHVGDVEAEAEELRTFSNLDATEYSGAQDSPVTPRL
jgi:hypothetical protein